ncbi:hypothetical protein AAG570_009306 [Ranatra chinensis]|uniref:SH3 domain-binding protein 5-like n=1 Tax=Ranatra chinensis TaxID=642074 RepID=A0ABD0YNP8_9HEMI
MLLNDSMRRLKVLTHKLGGCIERARPYYEALEIAKKAQLECQKAAVKFQRANEIHQAAKETVALAEARFLSKQHEWKFDSAWQEMLNHAIIKVTEAENQKAESGREHQKRATLFNVAEQRVIILEQKLRRSIIKSRPYFEEKALCQEQLDAQKKRVEELQLAVTRAKHDYSASLRRLEAISEEIHLRRRDKSGSVSPLPEGPREPGVGAELEPALHPDLSQKLQDLKPEREVGGPGDGACGVWNEVLEYDLDKCDVRSLGSMSLPTSSAVSEGDDIDQEPIEEDLEELRQKVRDLSVGGGKSENWERELSETVTRLDNALLKQECDQELRAFILDSQIAPTCDK